MLEDAKALLKAARISDITKPQHVCVLLDTTTLYGTLKTLADRGILSAPVIKRDAEGAAAAAGADGGNDGGNATEPGKEAPISGDVLGFVDVRDILLSFLSGLDVEATLKMSMLSKMKLLEQEGARFCENEIRSIATFGSDGNFLHSGMSKASLWEMIYSSMLYPERRSTSGSSQLTSAVHHRMAFFNKHSEITQIVSQSDIIRFIHTHRDRIRTSLDLKLMDIPGLCKHTIKSLEASESAFKALVLMGRYDISAVAVVNPAGCLVGNFSMSEMRSIMAEHFGALALPVGEFLALEHGTEYAGYTIEKEVEDTQAAEFAKRKKQAHMQRRTSHPGQDVGQDLVCVDEQSTFGDLLDLLVRHKVHRVYMVDGDVKPVGVTTLTDILYCIAGQIPAERAERLSAVS